MLEQPYVRAIEARLPRSGVELLSSLIYRENELRLQVLRSDSPPCATRYRDYVHHSHTNGAHRPDNWQRDFHTFRTCPLAKVDFTCSPESSSADNELFVVLS